MANSAPRLNGLLPSVTFGENAANAGGQLLDIDVAFTDQPGAFNGGSLVVSGLLAEDVVSILHQGFGAGQIGFASNIVWFGGSAIGTAAGGAGGNFAVIFTASATVAAVDALIQNLTYANSSDTPTASRTLKIDVVDSGGFHLVASGVTQSFTALNGADNPLNGLDAGNDATPSFGDLDGDGDLDALVGRADGSLTFFKNTGTSNAPVFVEQAGAANPFNGVDVGSFSAPSLADLDADGDLDAVVGGQDGSLSYYLNTGTALAASYVLQIDNGVPLDGIEDPFDGINVGDFSAPGLADLDGDGDLDAVVGEADGTLNYFRNTGTALAPVFTVQTGASNPFNGFDVDFGSSPSFADLDGDGDLDAIIGESDQSLSFFRNTGTAGSPVFIAQTGAANPFNGILAGAAPSFADLDGDGDADAVVGRSTGLFTYLRNDGAGAFIQVNVTAEDDAPAAVTLQNEVASLTENTSTAARIKIADIVVTDADGGSNTLSLTGANAGFFEIIGASLYLKAGTELDFETTAQYAVAIKATAISGSGSATSSTFILTVNNLTPETLMGTDGADALTGGSDSDIIIGGNGNDALSGVAGNDVLRGGAGVDTITGGPGADTFDFDSAGEFGGAAGARDRVLDFTAGDRIDLATIDANGAGAGNKTFSFLAKEGAAFTKAGQVGFDQKKSVTYVRGDINGDGKADFKIEFVGKIDFVKADFVL